MEVKMPSVFKRSLIKIGNGALAIVIPRPWLQFYELKAGDKLEVIANKKLIVRPIKQTTNK